MQNEILVRTISAVVLGVLVLVLTWIGGVAFRILSVVIMLLLSYEWFRMVATRDLSRFDRVGAAVTIAATGLAVLADMAVVALFCCVAGAVIVAVLRRIERYDLYAPAGLLYAGLFAIAFAALRESSDTGWSVILFIFAIVWSTDIMAFFGGRKFGGPKLAPRISPKKTWSGFLCGLLGGMIGGTIVASFFGNPHLLTIVVLSGVLSVIGQVGDLFESGLKRHFGVKDSSDLIPGHGGVMDRVDSLVFASIAAYLLSILLPGLDLIRAG